MTLGRTSEKLLCALAIKTKVAYEPPCLSVETGADMRLEQGWFTPALLFYVRNKRLDQTETQDRRTQPLGPHSTKR